MSRRANYSVNSKGAAQRRTAAGDAAAIRETRRLVEEGLASGLEPHEGVEAIKAEGRRKLSEL